MSNQRSALFQDALDVVGSLPEYQQEDLVDIVRNRLIEHRRYSIAGNIKKAKEDYTRGEIKKGTVNDLMKEITQ
ncbi:hypothetical protein [Candidatus Thiosymbion oneisti]|uniref:hypothetical protein n=1 Tax=Candidatus Thiosymbion oneisti TaxID=589554 RepID=UPI00114CBA09|nr:hypothetical protein [Candidatus Thiosymbion oneisti]